MQGTFNFEVISDFFNNDFLHLTRILALVQLFAFCSNYHPITCAKLNSC